MVAANTAVVAIIAGTATIGTGAMMLEGPMAPGACTLPATSSRLLAFAVWHSVRTDIAVSGVSIELTAAAAAPFLVHCSAYRAMLQHADGGLTFYVHYRVVSFHAPC
jgi:hypothetical protein